MKIEEKKSFEHEFCCHDHSILHSNVLVLSKQSVL